MAAGLLELDAFILANDLDERSSNALRESTPEVWAKVLERGDCVGAGDPSSMVLARIREAQRALNGGGKVRGKGGKAKNGGADRSKKGGKDRTGGKAKGGAVDSGKEDDDQGTIDGKGKSKGAGAEWGKGSGAEWGKGFGGDWGKGFGTDWGKGDASAWGKGAWADWGMGGHAKGKGYGEDWGSAWGGGGGYGKNALAELLGLGYGMGNAWGKGWGAFGGGAAAAAAAAELAKSWEAEWAPFGSASASGKGLGDMWNWGGKGLPGAGMRAGAAVSARPSDSCPEMKWISVNGGGSLASSASAALQDMPPDALVVMWDKSKEIFSSATRIIQELLEDREYHIEHDLEWDVFPEVAAEIKVDNCFAVASCPSRGKWAVGVAAGKKGRDVAAKLALAITIAAGTPKEAQIARSYPEFKQVCAASGVAGGGQQSLSSVTAASASASLSLGQNFAPRVYWINLEKTSTLTDQGLPADAPAMGFEKSHSKLYRNAQTILDSLCSGSEVTIVDDPDWKEFPEVGDTLKAAGAEENCMCVATCPALGRWAVGLGGKDKRPNAAKLALCVSVADLAPNLDEVSVRYPDFAALLSNVSSDAADNDDVEEPAPKRFKGS